MVEYATVARGTWVRFPPFALMKAGIEQVRLLQNVNFEGSENSMGIFMSPPFALMDSPFANKFKNKCKEEAK